MTLEEFCAIGKLDARYRYKREDAQNDYGEDEGNHGKRRDAES
jgi:hypothetical protein